MTLVPGSDSPPVLDALLRCKGDTAVSVCIPARDEAGTIGAVVEIAACLRGLGLVDEIVVVDDGSSDTTAARARAAGAHVVTTAHGGKGAALRLAAATASGEVLVFLDADVTNYTQAFVVGLVAPLLMDPTIQLVKGAYRRPLDGQPREGGRVTELLARPLLERFHPPLGAIAQPLAGETALRRAALHDITLADGYGIEIGLLIDIYQAHGIHAIAEVDLGARIHRNRPLDQLRPIARDVLNAVLARQPFDQHQESRHDRRPSLGDRWR